MRKKCQRVVPQWFDWIHKNGTLLEAKKINT